MWTLGRWLLVWAITVSLVLAGLLVAGGYFYLLDDRHPVVFNNLPLHVDKTSYLPGEKLIFTLDRCRNFEGKATLYSALRGPIVHFYPPIGSGVAPKGCSIVNSPPWVIPSTAPPGTYYIDAVSEFRVSHFVTRQVKWRTQTFSVVDKAP